MLAISGSLRARSTNTAALEALAQLTPAGTTITRYDDLAALPYFNPDHDKEGMALPEPVAHLRGAVARADGLVISSPEYAHGIPGVLKNALDWLISAPDFMGKPVLLLNISPLSVHAHAQLREVLNTMSARVYADGVYTLAIPRQRHEAASLLADADLSAALRAAVMAFVGE